MPDFEKIIGIVRVSTDEQARDGEAGFERQLVSIRRIVDSYPGVPVEIVEMKGISGAHVVTSPEWTTRVAPHLGPTLLVVVDHLDRLARMTDFDFGVLPSCKRSGTYIATPGQLWDPTNIGHNTMMARLRPPWAACAEICRRTMDRKEVMRKEGRWASDWTPIGTKYNKALRVAGTTPDSVKAAVHSRASSRATPCTVWP
ncbi:MAG: recombinase family protein [Myxococcota bacterium]